MNDQQLDIRTIDPHDESVLVPWYSSYAAALEHAVGVDEAGVYTLDEIRVQWQQPTSDQVRTGFAGLYDGEVVAVGALVVPQLENLDAALVEVTVHPRHQGRGHGRAMLEHVERAAAEAGRTRLTAEVRWRYEHGTDGHQDGGARDVRFAESAGFRLGLSDVQRWLDVPVDDALLDGLEAEAAARHDGYELRSWAGPVPDDLAAGWVALDATLMTEAPMGELEHEAAKADVARLREVEASVAQQGRTTYHSVALDALLDGLETEAAARHDGYGLRSWAGPVPDDLAAGWVALDATLMTEAPMGELEHEAAKADVARLREVEASVARQGRTTYHSVALDAAGEVVAYSMIVQGASPTAYQWGTLVHRDHRGHRLGLAVKVANQRLLQAERPDAVRVSTWNAEVNDHMIGVNERLGFRPVSRMGEFQKKA